MATALVLSHWVELLDDDGALCRTPLLDELAQPGRFAWRDVTGQLARRIGAAGSPNVVALLVRCDAALLAAIDADPRFRVLYDDGSRPAERTPTDAQFGAVRNFLSNRLGFTAAQIDAAIGTSHGGRTVAQIVTALLAYLRTL
ncbi:MAG: hypothetical protein IT318_04185 [Anaerolineales bacterium]|nr:hypothetical protein [Anaerolineales bacterium]